MSLIITLLFTGCDIWNERHPEFEYVQFNNIPPIGLTSIEETMEWVSDNIKYTPEEIHYFQSPGETYDLMAGDCEDITALCMYLIKVELHTDSVMLLGWNGFSGHAWVEVNGQWWEPQSALRCESYANVYTTIERWHYPETMWRAVELKRSIQ